MTDPGRVIVRIEHARRCGYCAPGLRQWFSGRDRTLREFVTRGIEAEWFLAQGDAQAERLVAAARAEAEGA